MDLDPWIIWLIIAVAAAIGEMAFGGDFFLAPFAIGAVLATLTALIGGPAVSQWAIFAVGTAVGFLWIRRIARRHLRTTPLTRTGTAALVGHTAIVTSEIDNTAPSGAVRLDGEVWTARAFDDDETFAAGQRVRIMEIRGATAVVTDD